MRCRAGCATLQGLLIIAPEGIKNIQLGNYLNSQLVYTLRQTDSVWFDTSASSMSLEVKYGILQHSQDYVASCRRSDGTDYDRYFIAVTGRLAALLVCAFLLVE